MATKFDDASGRLERLNVLGMILAFGWFLLSLAVLVVGLAGWAEKLTALLSFFTSAALLAGYVLAVLLPQRRVSEELRAIDAEAVDQRAAMLEILRRLRLGDLVMPASELARLPDFLDDGIRATTAALTSQIQRIQERSLEVAVIGGEVQSTSADLASGFSQQSAAVVEITATIEELARTAAQISQNAERQAQLADLAETEGDTGAEAVKAAVAGINGLSQRIASIAQRTDGLDSRSKEIYRILDLISEIAHDTHILSLNAAIEAETAGEHGRRFAVVAEEVRRLAHRARESAQSVRAHLEEFSGAIRSTVVATEEGSKEAAQVLRQAQAAQGAIEELRGAIGATSVAAQEISLATKEQRTASDQVAVTIKEVREVIQRMADALRNFSKTARNLNELALAIQLVSQAFRFPAARSLKHVFQERASELAVKSEGWEGIDSELRDLLSRSPYVEFCYLVDADGTLVACTTSPEWSHDERLPEGVEVGKNYSDRPWFKTVQQTRSPTITPLYESLLTSQQCFTVAAPVLTADGRQAGVLGADVNLTSWIRI
jgi:methyl-accepting chemotaxis protein